MFLGSREWPAEVSEEWRKGRKEEWQTLLDPGDLSLRRLLDLIENLVEGEGSELLDARNRNVLDAALRAVLEEIVVDLAGAEDEALHLVEGNRLVGLRVDTDEPRVLSNIVKSREG